MGRRFFNADIGAAAGLIVGIILGSLALDFAGADSAPAPAPASGQSAPRAAGMPAPTGSVVTSQR